MKFDEFLALLTSVVADRMPDCEVKEQKVSKVDGEYVGIACGKGDGVFAVLNVRGEYLRYCDGCDFVEIVDRVTKQLKDMGYNTPDVSLSGIMDWEWVKDRLIMQLVPAKNEKVKKMPHRVIGDIAVIYRIQIGDTGTVAVTDELMKRYGVEESVLYEEACKKDDYMLKNLGEVLGFGGDSSLWIGTMNGGLYGAACVMHPDFIDMVITKLGDKFYVLPSSVHEVLIVPDDGKFDEYELQEIVMAVNKDEVSPEDYLSDTVYYYEDGCLKYFNSEGYKVAV